MIKFEKINNQKIKIMQNDKEVGHIFTPSGSGETTKNAIQICGFTEAFDLWGCGIYKGFKDIQLLFDNKQMKGDFTGGAFDECIRCYCDPCCCENKSPVNRIEDLDDMAKEKVKQSNPFNIKREQDLKDRIIKAKK